MQSIHSVNRGQPSELACTARGRIEVSESLLKLEKVHNHPEALQLEVKKMSGRKSSPLSKYFKIAMGIGATVTAFCFSNTITGMTRREGAIQHNRYVADLTSAPYGLESENNNSLVDILYGIEKSTALYETGIVQGFPDPSEMSPAIAADKVSELYKDFLIDTDLMANVVLYGDEFKEKDPYLYKGLMLIVNEMKGDINVRDLLQYDLSMPDNAGGAMQFIDMLAAGASAAWYYTDTQLEQLRELLIKSTQLDEDTLSIIQTPYPGAKNMLQVVNSSLNNLCILNPAEVCDDFFYIRQTEEGITKDSKACRPETYASIVPWGPLLGKRISMVFIAEPFAERLREAGKDSDYFKSNKDFLKSILLHEFSHRAGTIDLYADMETFFKNTPPEERPSRLYDKMKSFVDNLEDIIEETPTPLFRDVLGIYLRYVKKFGIAHNEDTVNDMLNRDWLDTDEENSCNATRFEDDEASVIEDIKELLVEDPNFKAEMYKYNADMHALNLLGYFYNISKGTSIDFYGTTPTD